MNRQLNFFNYEQSYTYYTQQIMSIRQAKIHGETILAKPVLLIAIIDAIDEKTSQSLEKEPYLEEDLSKEKTDDLEIYKTQLN